MCYNYRTSLISFSLGLVSVIFAFKTRQYIIGTLILFYCQMQLSEAIIWKGIDDDNTSLNEKGTSYGKYLLATHNIAIGIGILLVVVFLNKRKLKLLDFTPLAIGIIFFLVIFSFVYSKKSYENTTYPLDRTCKTKSCQNNGNRLLWPYPHDWYVYSFLISLILLVIFIKPMRSKYFLGLIFTITFILTNLIQPRTVGSVWCFAAAILAPVIVGINYYITKNIPSSELMT